MGQPPNICRECGGDTSYQYLSSDELCASCLESDRNYWRDKCFEWRDIAVKDTQKTLDKIKSQGAEE